MDFTRSLRQNTHTSEGGEPRKGLVFRQQASGAPAVIRTPDLLVRSQTLYPAELRAHRERTVYGFWFNLGNGQLKGFISIAADLVTTNLDLPD
jgi:hypothetical protein